VTSNTSDFAPCLLVQKVVRQSAHHMHVYLKTFTKYESLLLSPHLSVFTYGVTLPLGEQN
jgi:hypothetical protein